MKYSSRPAHLHVPPPRQSLGQAGCGCALHFQLAVLSRPAAEALASIETNLLNEKLPATADECRRVGVPAARFLRAGGPHARDQRFQANALGFRL